MGKGNRAATNDMIRTAANVVARRESCTFDEQIVEAVEQELGWDLNEAEQRVAVTAYTFRRNQVLAQVLR